MKNLSFMITLLNFYVYFLASGLQKRGPGWLSPSGTFEKALGLLFFPGNVYQTNGVASNRMRQHFHIVATMVR